MGLQEEHQTFIIMLSRLAIRSATQSRGCLAAVSVRDVHTSNKLQERDLVNFPRRERPIEKSPVALGFIPQEWFDALYPKTGVTGPYMALAGVTTFLCSKEFYVMEHDFYVGAALIAVLTTIVKSVGPDYTAAINKEMDTEEAQLKQIRQGEIDLCLQQIQYEKEAQADATAWANVMRRMEQKHMVDWIISNVKQSITPAQETATLKKCISDLKALSAA